MAIDLSAEITNKYSTIMRMVSLSFGIITSTKEQQARCTVYAMLKTKNL